MKKQKTTLADGSQQLTIVLTGRMDTANAQQWGDEIRSICESEPHDALILDAADLTFISSTGLRVVLGLQHREKRLKVVEVKSAVYEVFEMTGFTKIIHIEKALRRISVEGCPIIGQGAIGIVYKTTPDTIVKVFREGSPLEELEKEINMAKEAFVLGMPTAISFDKVRVGNQYGLVYEMLNASTLSTLVRENPDRTDEYACQFAHLVRDLHSIHVTPGGVIPNAHENDEEALNKITRYFTEAEVDRLREVLHSIPQGDTLLHCDLHPKNVMMQEGELMLIDMGEVGYGNPLLDLAHTYSAMMGLIGDYDTIIGFPEQQSHRFFLTFIHEYYKGESEEEVQRHIEQIRYLSLARNFSWLSLSDSFPEELIQKCHKAYNERVASLNR